MKFSSKRLPALLLSVLLLLTLLTGCTRDGEGLSLAVSVGGAPESLDPAFAQEPADQTILVHLYENLMRVTADATGRTSVMGGMAKSVEEEETAVEGGVLVTYTFRLRAARWSDGQSVKAGDFVYAWRRLADPATKSPFADLLSIVSGYQEAREAGDMELLKVTAKNDTTLEVVVNGHHEWFLNDVCTAPATMPLREDVVRRLDAPGKDWCSDPTSLVANGPYIPASADGDLSFRLEANSRYYTTLPGPKDITFHFVNSAEDAQTLYDAKTIDAVWPLSKVQLDGMTEENFVPELAGYAAVFNCAQGPFADPLLREAMSLALDRTVLPSAGRRMAEGVVPFGVPENETGDFRTVGGPLLENDIEGLEERRQQARSLLQEAGYDSGQDLGELEFLYLQSEENDALAQVLCQQWQEVLQVQVTPKPLTQRQLSEALSADGYALAGLRSTADANDAECFLTAWTSESPENVAGYESSAYDTLLKIVASTADKDARLGCLHDAEALLLMDHVLAPLYAECTAWTLRDDLTGAFRDIRGWFYFADTMVRSA